MIDNSTENNDRSCTNCIPSGSDVVIISAINFNCQNVSDILVPLDKLITQSHVPRNQEKKVETQKNSNN